MEKSTVSEHFIAASRRHLERLETRALDGHALCVMFIDGTALKNSK
jgi:hypothetical protein